MVDIAHTLVSNSTQLDNVDLMGGPRDFTITAAKVDNSDQPLSLTLAEYHRPWKPGLTMRRLIAHIWESTESEDYVGKRVRLHRDEKVSFGTSKTGGTRVSHASHIDKRITVTLPTSKGKFDEFTVQPLIESAPKPTTDPGADAVADCTDTALLRGWWQSSGPERRAQIEARVVELNAAPDGTDDPAVNDHWDSEPTS